LASTTTCPHCGRARPDLTQARWCDGCGRRPNAPVTQPSRRPKQAEKPRVSGRVRRGQITPPPSGHAARSRPIPSGHPDAGLQRPTVRDLAAVVDATFAVEMEFAADSDWGLDPELLVASGLATSPARRLITWGLAVGSVVAVSLLLT
jgi:hypothetical protein